MCLLTVGHSRSQTDLTIRCMFPRFDDWVLSFDGSKKIHPGESGLFRNLVYGAAAFIPVVAYLLSRV
jgi:hypothetical protein